MANPTQFYLKEINKKASGYRPTWEPNKPLRVGDIGIMKNNVFVLVGSLEKMGVEVDIRKDEDAGQILDFSSDNGISIKTKAQGDVDPGTPSLGKLDIGFSVSFEKANSILFKIYGYKTHMLENLIPISREIKKMYKNDEWEEKWVIINEVVEADRATIMMSAEDNVSVGLKIKGEVNPAKMDIANADLSVGAEASGKLSVTIIGNEGITPLYRVIGIKKSFFGKVSIDSRDFELEGGPVNPGDIYMNVDMEN